MTPSQCKAARALLDWTQPQLAKAAGLGLSTIVDFERSRREVSAEAIQGMRSAFEKALVEFLDDGQGVRLNPPKAKGKRK